MYKNCFDRNSNISGARLPMTIYDTAISKSVQLSRLVASDTLNLALN